MKKNSTLIILLLITFASITFGMEPEATSLNKNWLALATDSLLSGTKPREQAFLQSKKFDNLTPEEQAETILFLDRHYIARDLDTAADAINSLTKVNRQLNSLINHPKICLQLIKRLALRFDCSNETAAVALPTKEAKNRLVIQKKFEKLFSAPLFNEEKFKNLYDQYKDYVDLDFTYRNLQDSRSDYKNTLLINSVMYPSPYKTIKIASLLETHKVNINYQNARKETALIKCAENCDNPQALQLLCNAPNIQTDLQDKYGDTALMKICLIKVSSQKEVREKSHKAICIALLLRAGADPEKTDDNGKTPLDILKDMGDNETEIELIQNAINKKYAPPIAVTKTKKSTAEKKRTRKK